MKFTDNRSNPHETVRSDDAAATPLVRYRAVFKSYGNTVVLSDLHLDVRRGERLVIIGPSGSGKTTVLRMLMTLDRPDTGEIEIAGRPLWPETGRRSSPSSAQRMARDVGRNVGMVFQQFNLFPHMTALENVALAPRRVLGLDRADADRRALELLALVGLEHKAGQHPARLSGGQQQRVAIARACAMEPEIMLFDEITSALDPELVDEVLGVVRRLAERTDMTMMFVTHEMAFARDIADRVVMFDGGRIVEQGSPTQIFSDPVEPRTREFLRAVIAR